MHLASIQRTRGFSLIEIMMVVVIIGIVVAILVPNLVGQDDKARLQAELSNQRAIAQALELYKMDNRRYPTTEQGLEALVTKPSGFPEPKNWGPEPYLRKYPLDQWDNDYVYLSDGKRFDLKSMGADGTDGGEDFDADVSYNEI